MFYRNSVNRNLEGSRYFKFDLDCQKVLPFQKLLREKMPHNLKIGKVNVPENIKESVTVDFKLWVVVRYKAPSFINEIKTPSFIATKSLILTVNQEITKHAFTPIIPHPATEYSTIYTSMKRYQDILNQRYNPFGSLWCDEGVCRIAKDIQLLKTDQFKNIFLGMGCFHIKKIVFLCLGKYLEKISIEKVFEITRNIWTRYSKKCVK